MVAASARRVERGPVPEWVGPAEAVEGEPAGSAVPSTDAVNGVIDQLLDTRVFIGHRRAERFVRRVRRTVSPSGVEHAAEVSIEYDPAYQQIRLHHARVLRAGTWLDVLPSASERFFEREVGLERRIVRGLLTWHLILPDIRTGDVVDVAYTLSGHPSLWGDEHATYLPLGNTVPTLDLTPPI